MDRFTVTTQKTVTETFQINAPNAATAQANYAIGTPTGSTTGARSITSVQDLGPVPGTPIYDFGDYRDTRGRTPVDPSIFKHPHSCVLAVSGQSIPGNYSALSGWNPTGEIYELNVWDGKVYRVDQNLIMGSDGGVGAWAGRTSFLPYLAAQLIGAGKAARVLLCCAIQGGTNAYDWCPIAPADAHGVTLGSRRTVIMQVLANLGLAPNWWIHDQGPSDSDPSKAVNATTGQNWSDLTMWGFNADLRGPVGYTGPIQVPLDSIAPWGNATLARQGQQITWGRTDAGSPIAVGPDEDQWNMTRVDGVHFGNNERYYAVNSGFVPSMPVF